MDPICGLSLQGGHICPAPHWNGMEYCYVTVHDLRHCEYALFRAVAVAVGLTESGSVGTQCSVDEQLHPVARQHLAVGRSGGRVTGVIATGVVEGGVEDAKRKTTLIGQSTE